jgi:UDP-N-acetylglucosamine 4,6-dehydratase/5-epimerase
VHEIMCPVDEAHLTLEFPDHFVIQPAILFDLDYRLNAAGEKGVPVDEDFQYSSDRNDQWLEGVPLAAMIKSTGIEM